MSQLDEWLERGRTADGVRMSDERLSEVFDLVKDSENWKMPIQARVPKAAATQAEIVAAVCWFAGGMPDFLSDGDHWWVIGAGYYVWVGA